MPTSGSRLNSGFGVRGQGLGKHRTFARRVPVSLLLALSILFGIGLSIAGCASTDRLPAVPLALAAKTNPIDIPNIRFYPDTDADQIAAVALQARKRMEAAGTLTPKNGKIPPNYFLAISGGGDDGAFGAGLLAGWSSRGDRPQFGVVTGISTGALSAPFAYLGTEYDPQLKKVYTDTTADDIFVKRELLAAVADDAMTDTTPLRDMIARFLDEDMIRKIGEEYGKGRLLLILTTNLDQSRPVIWNIGAIAASGHPRSRQLIVQILRASAAIPAVFPPVMIDVAIDGKQYQEMHVDGGAVAQAFLYPPTFKLKEKAAQFGVKRERIAYVIRNGRLFRPEESVKRQTLSIAQQAISTMTATSGVNDTYRMYLTTKRDGVGFNLAYVDDDFKEPYKGPFDKDYMNKLFAYGYEKGRAGYTWRKTPPGYSE